jgi:hypothetical protein
VVLSDGDIDDRKDVLMTILMILMIVTARLLVIEVTNDGDNCVDSDDTGGCVVMILMVIIGAYDRILAAALHVLPVSST